MTIHGQPPGKTVGEAAPEDALRLFFDGGLRCWEEAARRAGGSFDRFYCIGGYSLRFRFAGPALLPVITPALAHSASPPALDPALTVHLWDGSSTGVGMPPLPWTASGGSAGRTDFLRVGSLLTAYQLYEDILSAVDTSSGRAIFRVRDPGCVSADLRVAPLRLILNRWAAGRDLHMIHAGAVGTAGGGVLFAGPGGSGKSTCALACLAGSLDYLAEDYCLLSIEPLPRAFSLYSLAKVDRVTAIRLPHLAGAILSGELFDGDKTALPLHDLLPGRILPDFPVKAVVLPVITGQAALSLAPVSPARALAALAPSTIFQQAGSGEEVFHALARLVRSLPCLELRMGPDLSALPGLVANLAGGNG